MTLTTEDFVNAVAKLNDLTRHGLIKWHRIPPVGLAGSIGTAYETKQNGQKLRLVEYSPPRVRGSFQSPLSNERVRGALEPREVVVEIVDDQGIPIYEFPKVQGITDLFDTVRYQIAGIEEFIKSLASDK
jgi:hypothetical protein